MYLQQLYMHTVTLRDSAVLLPSVPLGHTGEGSGGGAEALLASPPSEKAGRPPYWEASPCWWTSISPRRPLALALAPAILSLVGPGPTRRQSPVRTTPDG